MSDPAYYWLWDNESGNALGTFDTLDDLVRFVYGMGQVNPTGDVGELTAWAEPTTDTVPE